MFVCLLQLIPMRMLVAIVRPDTSVHSACKLNALFNNAIAFSTFLRDSIAAFWGR